MKKTIIFFSLLGVVLLLSNYLVQSSTVDSKLFVLDLESPEIERKFLPHFIPISERSYFTCWEQGAKEINNNTIECRIYNKDFSSYEIIPFNKPSNQRRYFPVDLIKIDSTFYLYFMEMDINVYQGKGVSSLKRAELLFSEKKIIIDNRSIWTTTIGAGMQLIPHQNHFLIPAYENETTKQNNQKSQVKVLKTNERGNKISNNVPISNNTNHSVFEPSIAMGDNDTALMVVRSNEIKKILLSHSFDGGKSWSPLRETGIISSGSMSRIFYSDSHFFIIHNDSKNGARNSLALTVLDDVMTENYTTLNLISHNNDFFSNFSAHVEDGIVYLTYQRLIRSSKYSSPPDRIEMITFTIEDIY